MFLSTSEAEKIKTTVTNLKPYATVTKEMSFDLHLSHAKIIATTRMLTEFAKSGSSLCTVVHLH